MHSLSKVWAILNLGLVVTVLAYPVHAAEPRLRETPVLRALPELQPDVTIRVGQSAFNKLASAIQPRLTTSGSHPLRVTFGICPFCKTIQICSGNWTVRVEDINFDVNPSGLDITGKVDAIYHCGTPIPFSANFTASGDVTHNAEQRYIRVFAHQGRSVQLCFKVPIVIVNPTVCVPSLINVGPTLTLPFLSITGRQVAFQTARGPQGLYLTPTYVVMTKKDGHIGLQGDVTVW